MNKKGNKTKMSPIMDIKDIKTIKTMLANKPLDSALFTIGINLALRASDLLTLKVWQVKDLKAGDDIEIRDIKTQKQRRDRRITFNKTAVKAIQRLLSSKPYDDMDYLFKGQRGPITVKGLNSKVKAWCNAINLKGNYGTHSLRKTWGYHQRVTFGVDLPTLQKCFNHRYQHETLIYLCIQDEEIKSAFMNEL